LAFCLGGKSAESNSAIDVRPWFSRNSTYLAMRLPLNNDKKGFLRDRGRSGGQRVVKRGQIRLSSWAKKRGTPAVSASCSDTGGAMQF
jgi:hypothetical protein